ncbi:MAG: Head fiber protein [Clostridia bacterium]|nr:Head fiber protein [Clostridia bacterium]
MSYNAKNYVEQGGDVTVVGGELNVAAGGKISKAGTQANHIADIGNEATGTQIATAVNAILAALEGVGILKTS